MQLLFCTLGSIIFACHKLNPPSRSDANSSTSMQQLGYSTGYNVQQNPPFYGQGSSYALPPGQTASYTNTYISQSGSGIQGSYSPQRWSQSKYPSPSEYNATKLMASISLACGHEQPPFRFLSAATSSRNPGMVTSSRGAIFVLYRHRKRTPSIFQSFQFARVHIFSDHK